MTTSIKAIADALAAVEIVGNMHGKTIRTRIAARPYLTPRIRVEATAEAKVTRVVRLDVLTPEGRQIMERHSKLWKAHALMVARGLKPDMFHRRTGTRYIEYVGENGERGFITRATPLVRGEDGHYRRIDKEGQ